MRQLIDQSIEFPIAHDRLIDQLGELEVTAPTGDSVLASEILSRAGEPTYRSSEILYTTIIGNLDDTFIGRKHYDDRGGSHTHPDPRRATQRSL